MSFTFERPVGAVAAAMEMEYIASLHQADDQEEEGWQDASIEASDVVVFMLSRYGIVVSEEDVQKHIFNGLAGGDSGDDTIDIVELLAILIIPYLSKVSKSNKENGASNENNEISVESSKMSDDVNKIKPKEATNMISNVLNIILMDSTGSLKPPPLTKHLLRSIFTYYEEYDLIDDENLLDEMIKLASEGIENPVLDKETFQRALTKDILLYNTAWESTISTNYEDVFESKYDETLTTENVQKVEHVFTFPQIDFYADTFRSKIHFTCVLVATIVSYVAYLSPQNTSYYIICTSSTLSCKIGQSVVTWLTIMANAVVFGMIMIPLLNLGNNPQRHSVRLMVLESLAGITFAVLLLFLPIFVPFKLSFMDTFKSENQREVLFDRTNQSILQAMAYILSFSNFVRIFAIFFPKQERLMRLLDFLSNAGRYESSMKQACSLKIEKMINDAYSLHATSQEETRENQSVALLNYTKESEKKETYGGFFWCWKHFLLGKSLAIEGIWVHSRMITMNTAQFCLAISYTVAIIIITNLILEVSLFDAATLGISVTSTSDNFAQCQTEFDPSQCAFPQDFNVTGGYAICGVSYSDECNLTAVPSALKTFCNYLDQAVDLSEIIGFDPDFVASCPNMLAPPDLTYTFTNSSNETSFCKAAITECIASPNDDNFGLCLVGIRTSGIIPLPYDFTGPQCSEIEPIQKIMIERENLTNTVTSFIPKKWVIRFSAAIGVILALTAGLGNAFVTIPSIIVTTQKFRTGVLPSLRDARFKRYRQDMISTSILIGASIWGTTFMMLFMYFVGFIPTFLLTYEVTSGFVIRFLSLFIGVVITIVIKIVATKIFVEYNFAAFFRKRPLLCNCAMIGFECWNLAITSSYILARAAKLIVASIIYVGRFDTPILADGVGDVLDPYPFIFRTDLLMTEAHRHPYMERLGLMYMMKLRHHDNFAKQAGSIWRLLFIFALMPWLRKYRIGNTEFTEEQRKEGTRRFGKKSRSQLDKEITELKRKLAAFEGKNV